MVGCVIIVLFLNFFSYQEEMFTLTSRNNFSLFVMNLEGQLFHANFEHLTGVMMKMTQGQLLGYREVGTVQGGPADVNMCMFAVCSW